MRVDLPTTEFFELSVLFKIPIQVVKGVQQRVCFQQETKLPCRSCTDSTGLVTTCSVGNRSWFLVLGQTTRLLSSKVLQADAAEKERDAIPDVKRVC